MSEFTLVLVIEGISKLPIQILNFKKREKNINEKKVRSLCKLYYSFKSVAAKKKSMLLLQFNYGYQAD